MWPWEIYYIGHDPETDLVLRIIDELPMVPESMPLASAVARKFRLRQWRQTAWMVVWTLVAIHAVLLLAYVMILLGL